MCNFCNPESEHNLIWVDPLTRDFYIELRTGHWDDYDDDWETVREYGIQYCPFCGQKLFAYGEEDNE